MQFFELGLTQSEKVYFDVGSVLPGPERLWELFAKSHGPLHCKKREFFLVDSPNGNASKFLEDLLLKINTYPHLFAIPADRVGGIHLLRISKAQAPHSCESLILDILETENAPLPQKLKQITCYEFFTAPDQPDTRPELLETLEKIFLSELKEYLYDQKLFHFFIRPGAFELKNNFPLEAEDSGLPAKSYSHEELIQKFSSIPDSWLATQVQIKSHAPRQEDVVLNLEALEKTLPQFSIKQEKFNPRLGAAYLPKKAVLSSGENQNYFSSSDTLPLSRNSLLPGYIQDFDSLLLIPSIAGQLLSECPISLTKRLYILGPFHRHNYEVQSSIVNFLQRLQEIDPDFKHEVAYSIESWGRKFLSLIAQSSGWELDAKTLAKLWEMDQSKTRFDYGLFILSSTNPEVFLPDLLKNKIEFLPLGLPSSSSTLEFHSGANKEALDWSTLKFLFQSSSDKKLKYEWTYNERMSPIYGYDSAAIFPAQMTIKVNYRNKSEIQWAQSFFKRPPHPQSLRAYARNIDENPRTYEKYFDTHLNRKILSTALTGPEISENPLHSGLNMVDFTVRQLLCYTRHLCEGAEVRISVLPPRVSDSKYSAALHLAIEGTLQGLSYYKMKLVDLDISGYTSSSLYPELRLLAEYPARELALPFDGLRMTEEVLFALGPRPPFVEVGSKILRHVRVISNYVTHLDLDKQKEVYEKILELFVQGKILTAYPLGQGGIIEGLVELGLKGQAGVQIRPGIPPIELFSASPGRILIGVSPQEAKEIEKIFPAEYLTKLGTVVGSKIHGASLDELAKIRQGKL